MCGSRVGSNNNRGQSRIAEDVSIAYPLADYALLLEVSRVLKDTLPLFDLALHPDQILRSDRPSAGAEPRAAFSLPSAAMPYMPDENSASAIGSNSRGALKPGSAAMRAAQLETFFHRPKSIAEISAKATSQRQTRSAIVGSPEQR